MNAMTPTTAALLLLVACGGADDDGIIDIGKPCDAAQDCDHVCVGERGASSGYCSIECNTSTDCPSDSDCVMATTTGELRCWPAGLIVAGLDRLCAAACDDVDYFCSTAEISATDVEGCRDWCAAATDADREELLICVDAEPRYTSACPASECVLAILR